MMLINDITIYDQYYENNNYQKLAIIIKIGIMKKVIYLSILLVLFITTSCSSDSDEVIVIPPVNNNIFYTTHVKTIIDSNCLNCHGAPLANGATIPLLTLANVQEAVQNRNLIGRVESGNMPQGGSPLTATQVQTIKDWEAGGFK